MERLFPEQTLPDETLFEITVSRVISEMFHMMWESSYAVALDGQKGVGIVPEIMHEIEGNYRNESVLV